MTREEAIKLLECSATELVGTMMQTDEQTAVNQLQRYVDAYDMAIAALRKQETVTNRNGLDWLSVDERLPKKITNKVLVYCKNGYIGFGHYENFRGAEDWYNLESGKPFREWDLEDCETYEVTHWMPLPEPPEVEI